MEALRSRGGVAGALRPTRPHGRGKRKPSPPGTKAVSRGEASLVDRFWSICIPRGSEDKEGTTGARRRLSGTHRPKTCSTPQPLLSLLSEAAGGADPGTRERPGNCVHIDDQLESHASQTPTLTDVRQNVFLRTNPGVRWARGQGEGVVSLSLGPVPAELGETEGRRRPVARRLRVGVELSSGSGTQQDQLPPIP